MELLQIIALALVQGLTEFLPVSSSAHLILLPLVTEWQDQGLAFDVALHLGTLLAVILYFRKTLNTLCRDWSSSVLQRKNVGDSRLAWAVILGTIPVGLVGLLFSGFIENYLRSPVVIAITTVIFALLLAWADWRGKQQRDEYQLRIVDIFFIGLAQAAALIPGTSRSGITITAGLLLGLNRQAAARFSFLLSIPVILLASGLQIKTLIEEPSSPDWGALGLGVLLSAVSAYFCIHYFIKIIEKMGLWPFVLYRLLLGFILLKLYL